MGRWVLAGKYSAFLERAPHHATRALIAAVDRYIDERHGRGGGLGEENFQFEGREVTIKTDHSEIWDDSIAYQDDEPVKLLDSFTHYLERISENDEKAGVRREIVNLLTKENHNAILWRRLLIAGTKFPQTLGWEIRSLAWTKKILQCFDTTIVVGDFLKAIFHLLATEEREHIERAVLSVTDSIDEEQIEAAEHLRNRLLGCLDEGLLVTEEAKIIKATEEAPPNQSPFGPVQVSWGSFTEKDFLIEQGVPVDAEQNLKIQNLCSPVSDFASKHLNTTPTQEEVEQLVPSLRALHVALQTAEADGVHPQQRHTAWSHLADACDAIVRNDNVTCETESGAFILNVLLEASTYPDPTPSPEIDKAFDRHPSWGPAARIDAATGLIRLARHKSCAEARVIEALERLSKDSVPSVRFQIAINLNSLYYTAPDLMWKLLKGFSQDEQRYGLLGFLVNGPLHSLARFHPDQISQLCLTIFDRIRDGEGAKEVRQNCASIFVGLYLWQNHPLCGEIVNQIISDPAKFNTELGKIIFDLRSSLNIGPVEPPNEQQDKVRREAFQLLERILVRVQEELRSLEDSNQDKPFASWDSAEQENASQLAHLANAVGNQIYFASGAFRHNGDEGKVPLGKAERTRFLDDSEKVLELLTEFGYASLAHHLIETLAYLIDFNPEKVFLLVGKAVRGSKRGGYQYESMAADLIVQLVERFIAEFGYVLREKEECRHTLIEILDTFVEAGWASARRLTYRMEEIFR